jgi:hypothetical protein
VKEIIKALHEDHGIKVSKSVVRKLFRRFPEKILLC